MEKQFKTAEEQLEHIRRLNRERKARNRENGNEHRKGIVLNTEDNDKLNNLLAKLISLSLFMPHSTKVPVSTSYGLYISIFE